MNAFGIDLKQLELEMQRAVIFEIAFTIIVLIVLFGALYWVIKSGVRDGITESGSRQRTHEKPAAPPGYRWALVKETATTEDMRAD